MTKLEAVQQIVSRCGKFRPSELETDGTSDASEAERILDEEGRDLMSKGWHVAEEFDDELTPDGSGHVALPDGVLTIDTHGSSMHRNVTQRGRRLYDLDNRTYVFTDTTLVVRYVLWIDFACLPEPIQRYAMLLAASRYCVEHGVENNSFRDRLQQRIDTDLIIAKRAAVKFNENAGDVNILDTYEAQNIRGVRVEVDGRAW